MQDYTISTHHTFILGLVNILLQFIFFIDKYLLNLSSKLYLHHKRFFNILEWYLFYSNIFKTVYGILVSSLFVTNYWYCLHVNPCVIKSETIITGYAFKSLEAQTCMIKRDWRKQICENKEGLARKLRCENFMT